MVLTLEIYVITEMFIQANERKSLFILV